MDHKKIDFQVNEVHNIFIKYAMPLNRTSSHYYLGGYSGLISKAKHPLNHRISSSYSVDNEFHIDSGTIKGGLAYE